jgi:hypothetical protein
MSWRFLAAPELSRLGDEADVMLKVQKQHRHIITIYPMQS